MINSDEENFNCFKAINKINRRINKPTKKLTKELTKEETKGSVICDIKIGFVYLS